MLSSQLYQQAGLAGLMKTSMASPAAAPFIAAPKCAWAWMDGRQAGSRSPGRGLGLGARRSAAAAAACGVG